MHRVVIIDYGSGNLKSAYKAFEKSASSLFCEPNILVSKNFHDLKDASHIVLPGVGSFADCFSGLSSLPKMLGTLHHQVIKSGKPFLGICVGMQLLADRGMENGETFGLGWISGEVVQIAPASNLLKVPHMGWNNLKIFSGDHAVLKGIKNDDHAYFVHSFHFQCESKFNCYATVNHGGEIAAIIGKENMIGTQFHPEKSQRTGLQLIQNFINWNP